VSSELAARSFVISGTFATHGRDQLKELIEEHGGRNVAAVSAKVDYLVAGDNMGPAKRAKAEKLGVKIISLDELLDMISPSAEKPAPEPVEIKESMPIQGSLF
jgi:DNA ligase (NAD+)